MSYESALFKNPLKTSCFGFFTHRGDASTYMRQAVTLWSASGSLLVACGDRRGDIGYAGPLKWSMSVLFVDVLIV